MRIFLLLCLTQITVDAWLATSAPQRRRSSTTQLHHANNNQRSSSLRTQHRDIVVVGGGLAGLSAALMIAQVDPSRHVTILEQQDPLAASSTTVASLAAAGMLAPQSERLPPGPLLDLCRASRDMYADFVNLVESLAAQVGTAGEVLRKDTSEDWSVGYLTGGGFLAPALAGDAVATWAPPEESGAAVWLEADQVRELEPNLHPSVVGGWWFPSDASVDARRLTESLRAAVVAAGVQLLTGDDYAVTSLDLGEKHCHGLWLASGRYIQAKSILIANGAWMRQLLPVPIEPHKGQSLSLRMPDDRPPLLRRVLFAQDSYIVPKADGRIIVGATVEAGSYDGNVTPAGLLHILTHALQLVPGLKDLPIEETWVGLRPTTPDKGPILGSTPWDNLYLAGGYWRNGVLLAPKTGQLLADLITGQDLSADDQALLDAFAWDRFTDAAKGQQVSANARYAASMHPIHTRRSGAGVAAAVGTELGVYSSARSAREERSRDRASLWSDSDNALEQAAAAGKRDSAAYFMDARPTPPGLPSVRAEATSKFEGSVDAYTVGSSSDNDSGAPTLPEPTNGAALEDAYSTIRDNKGRASVAAPEAVPEERPDPGFRIYHKDSETGETQKVPPYTSPGDFLDSLAQKKALKEPTSESKPVEELSSPLADLTAVYQAIQANKAKNPVQLDDDSTDQEERPDPGFRIYHKDPTTGEVHEVPPYTSPGDFFASIAAQKLSASKEEELTATPNGASQSASTLTASTTPSSTNAYNEQTYDGYTDIQQANARSTREEELQAMRQARRLNRLEDTIDYSKIGVLDFGNESSSW